MQTSVTSESVINLYKEKLADANHELIVLKALIADLQMQNEVLRNRLNKAEKEKTAGE